ncbi:MAG TPA: HAMP domain-containing sensor histidine kinase, partial [Terriglobales bacterium]
MIATAIVLNISWIIHWREVVPLVLGIIFFAILIAGMVWNTIFLVREIRRNEQHDSFINAVTHELKTPVASIRLYLETLRTRNLDENQRKKFYEIMLDDTDRLMSTVEQVLRAAQSSHKRGQEHWQELDLAELTTDCVEVARTRHGLTPEQMKIENHFVSQEESQVRGDADELRAAIGNLLDNAVKYSPTMKEITVVLTSEGRQALVRVADKGVGIPRGELKRVFRRFYRVPLRAMAKVKGTGLGLFIVKAIAERHGGAAWADSEGE